MKNLALSYFLCALSFISPLAGLHRFYLGKTASGFFYLITWGFLGIGSIIDLIRMPTLVEEANLRALLLQNPQILQQKINPSTAEQQILRVAEISNGTVTAQMVAMKSGLSLLNAKNELEHLKNSGFCTKDVAEDGAEIYTFVGLTAKRPLL